MKKNKQQKRATKQGAGTLSLHYSPPLSRKVLLTYSSVINITEGAAGAGAARYFRLNGVYDVDTTLGSTSTPGFSEWAAFYQNYRVWKTRVRIEGFATGGVGATLAQVSLVPNGSAASLPANIYSWPVQPFAKSVNICYRGDGGMNKATLDSTFDLPKLAHLTSTQYANDMDFSASNSTTPSRQLFAAVTVVGFGSAAVVTLTFQIWVSMLVEFFNPVQLNA